jgi:hypothetical protein
MANAPELTICACISEFILALSVSGRLFIQKSTTGKHFRLVSVDVMSGFLRLVFLTAIIPLFE